MDSSGQCDQVPRMRDVSPAGQISYAEEGSNLGVFLGLSTAMTDGLQL